MIFHVFNKIRRLFCSMLSESLLKMLKNFWMMVWLTVLLSPILTALSFTSPLMEMLLFVKGLDFFCLAMRLAVFLFGEISPLKDKSRIVERGDSVNLLNVTSFRGSIICVGTATKKEIEQLKVALASEEISIGECYKSFGSHRWQRK